MAFVKLKPSGYATIKSPGSPPSRNGGWTGFMVVLLDPQLPTQKLLTSDISIHIPSKLILLCHVVTSFVHQAPAASVRQSGNLSVLRVSTFR